MGVLKSTASAVVLFLAAGCVNVERVDYDKGASNAKVRKIALVVVKEPLIAPVLNLGGAAGAFGLIGGLVQAGMNETNGQRFKAALDNRGITFAPALVSTLTDELSRRGFEVTYLAADQGPVASPDGKSMDYSAIRTDADAVLHVQIIVNGYASPAMALTYQPWVVMSARLVDGKTRKVLYVRALRSGFGSTNEAVEDVGFDTSYQFDSADALVLGADRAGLGLQDSHRRVALRIAEHLR